MLITNLTEEKSSVDVKRFYAPIIVSSECPLCHGIDTRDLRTSYLDFPALNVPIDIDFCCVDGCGKEWTEKVILRITMEPS